MYRTLNYVTHNEQVLAKGLSEIKKHIIEEDRRLNMVLGYTSMLITLAEHAMELDKHSRNCKTSDRSCASFAIRNIATAINFTSDNSADHEGKYSVKM